MSAFVRLGDGLDMAPIAMALARQEALRNAVLFNGEWQGEYYAFPMMRGMLLDVMRRGECGDIVSLEFVTEKTFPPLPDSSLGVLLLAVAPIAAKCGEEEIAIPAGAVVFCSCAEELRLFGNIDSCALVMIFSPLP